MRKILFLTTLYFCVFSVNSQILSINETADYINKLLLRNPNGNSYYAIKIESDGMLNIINKFTDYNKELDNCKFHYSEITLSKNSSGVPSVMFLCGKTNNISAWSDKISCVTCSISATSGSKDLYRIVSKDNYINDKLFNALSFLISSLKENRQYERNDSDSFAPQNFNSSITGLKSSEKIKLETHNGVFKVWVKIGTATQQFVLDSGASEMSISKELEEELLKKGIIKKQNYIQSALYRIADGSVIECKRALLTDISIGSFKLKNVITSIGMRNSPLLLGRSFLNKFKKWSVNNSTNELQLEK